MNCTTHIVATIRAQAMELKRKIISVFLKYRTIIISFVCICGCLFAGYLFVHAKLKSESLKEYAQETLANIAGVPVSVQKVETAFPLRVSLTGISANTGSAFTGIEQVLLQIDFWSLLKAEIRFSAIKIVKASFTRASFSSFTGKKTAKAQNNLPAEGSSKISIQQIECEKCSLLLEPAEIILFDARLKQLASALDVQTSVSSKNGSAELNLICPVNFDTGFLPALQSVADCQGSVQVSDIKLPTKILSRFLSLASTTLSGEAKVKVNLNSEKINLQNLSIKTSTGYHLTGNLRVKYSDYILESEQLQVTENDKILLALEKLIATQEKIVSARGKAILPLERIDSTISGLFSGNFEYQNGQLVFLKGKINQLEYKRSGFSIVKGDIPIEVQNSVLTGVDLQILFQGFPGKLHLAGRVTKDNYSLTGNLYFANLSLNALGEGAAGPSTMSRFPLSLHIHVATLNIYENLVNNFHADLNLTSGVRLNNINMRFADADITGMWELQGSQHQARIAFQNINSAKIKFKQLGSWYGLISGSANLSFKTKQSAIDTESLNGQVQLTSSKGRIVNSFIQNGFLAGPFGALENRMRDLEYESLRLDGLIAEGTLKIKAAHFAGQDWKISILGQVNPDYKGDLTVSLSFTESLLRDVLNPARLLLESQRTGKWYTKRFACRGNTLSSRCWQ